MEHNNSDPFFYLLESTTHKNIGACPENVFHRTPTFDWDIYSKHRGVKFNNNEEAYCDWLSIGRRLGLKYNSSSNTMLKIVLKAKDEPELLEPWIEHHKSLVGLSNLIIVDTGSTNKNYIDKLNSYRNSILILDYKRHYDSLHNPVGNYELFSLLSRNCKYITILDADEFLFFYDGVNLTKKCYDTLNQSDVKLYCGTWLFNATLPVISKDGCIDLNSPVAFYNDENAISKGTFSGKAIMSTSILLDTTHLGHNLHHQPNVRYINEKSFGNVVILHLANLGAEITKRRVLAHLKGMGIEQQDIERFDTAVDFINNYIGECSSKIKQYVNQYFGRHKINVSTDKKTICINIHDTAIIDSNENIFSNFNFMSLIK